MTREEIVDKLENIAGFFHARADMAIGDGKMLLLSWCNAAEEARGLIEALEPRVMTWEEAKASVNDGPFIIFEVRDSTGSELDFGVLVDDSYEMSEGSLLTVEFFPEMEDAYGKRFRMWTSRPDNATREATPWE